MICMRTTLNLDEALYRDAAKAVGVEEKTKLIHMGLKALISQVASKRLSKLYGSIRDVKVAKRGRSR